MKTVKIEEDGLEISIKGDASNGMTVEEILAKIKDLLNAWGYVITSDIILREDD